MANRLSASNLRADSSIRTAISCHSRKAAWRFSSRRSFVRRVLIGLAGFRRSVRAARQLAPHPEISSFDISLLNDWITPAEFFFVRDHFPAPNVFTDGWLISIEGEVAAPYSLTYQELIQQA